MIKTLVRRAIINNRWFSDNKPTQESTGEVRDRQKQIQQLVNSKKFVLFMKGTPEMPECGYSAFVVEVLKFYRVDNYEAVNILTDPQLREQMKKFSEWPTFPQLYVGGKLVGGADILQELHKEGKLKTLLAP